MRMALDGAEVSYVLVPEPLDDVSELISEIGRRRDERHRHLVVVLHPKKVSQPSRIITALPEVTSFLSSVAPRDARRAPILSARTFPR